MAHDHHHSIPTDKNKLLFSFVIITGFMTIEFLGGYWFNSLTLIADASHMANDAFSLGLAFIAITFSKNNTKLANRLALINGSSLIFIGGYIIWEAIKHLRNPEQVISLPMIAVATIGLIVNIIVALIMLKADRDNLNIRAAYMHVLADLFGSIIAIFSGLSIYFFNWHWVDPIASLILSLLVMYSGLQITYTALFSSHTHHKI